MGLADSLTSIVQEASGVPPGESASLYYAIEEAFLHIEAWHAFAIVMAMYFPTLLRMSVWGNGSNTEKEEKSVEAQAEAANKAGTWLNLVIMVDRDGIMALLKENPEAIKSRGPVGETMCHFCLLLSSPERTELCKELIEMFPDAIRDEYIGEPYAGENLLHIAIVNRNIDMVKWLIEREPSLIEGRATGAFFQRTGLFYFGEYPLSFAVCSNQANIVDILLAAGANILAQDSNGNTAFHLCVWWKRKEMYAYLEDETKRLNLSPGVDPTKIQNTLKEACEHAAGEGLTCLNLAAYIGDLEMFEWMLKRKMVVQWSYGTVTSYLIPLEEIDWKRGKRMGAIEWVVDLAHSNFMNCKHINTLVDRKWHRFAAQAFENRFRKAMFFMVSFSFLTVCDEGVYGSWSEMLFIAGLELVLVVGCVHKLLDEIQEIQIEGIHNYLSPRSMLENVCSFIPCSTFVLLFLSHHTVQWHSLEHVLRLLTAALGWVYMMYFLLGMKRTGHFVVMIAKMLVRDLVPFSLFTSVFIGMFSMLFFILFEKTPTLANFAKHLQISFDGVIGNMNLDITETYMNGNGDEAPSMFKIMLAKLILLAFVVMCIVLLNLLVAMMGDTYSMISADAELEWMLQRASTIFSIEQNMSDGELADNKVKYWVEVNGERFLRIEEEIKGVFDEFQTTEGERAKGAAALLADKKAARMEKERELRAKRGGDVAGEDGPTPKSFKALEILLDAKMDVLHTELADLVIKECADVKQSVVRSNSRIHRSLSQSAVGEPESFELASAMGGMGGMTGLGQMGASHIRHFEKTAELNAKVELLTSQVSGLMQRNSELEAQVKRRPGSNGRFSELIRKASQASLTSPTGGRTLPKPPSQSSLLMASPE